MQPFEDLREGLALLEVQATVVVTGRLAVAAIAHVDQVLACLLGLPTGAHGKGRVELPLDIPDTEVHRTGGGTGRCGQRHCQETSVKPALRHHCIHCYAPKVAAPTQADRLFCLCFPSERGDFRPYSTRSAMTNHPAWTA
ncbi:hypothetical protein D3C78_1129150 [compost metagenome]